MTKEERKQMNKETRVDNKIFIKKKKENKLRLNKYNMYIINYSFFCYNLI